MHFPLAIGYLVVLVVSTGKKKHQIYIAMSLCWCHAYIKGYQLGEIALVGSAASLLNGPLFCAKGASITWSWIQLARSLYLF